jgi:hypothetical protein
MKHENVIRPIGGESQIVSDFCPLDICLSTVWHIVEGRNAWHSTWSSTYYPRAFGLSPEELKDKCEAFRTQGSVFTICSAPIAVMSDGSRILGLTSVNEKPEIKYLSLLGQMDEKQCLRSFRYVDPNWLRIFDIPKQVRLQAGYKPRDFRSFSHGGAYRLGWAERQPRDYSGFLNFYKKLRKLTKKGHGASD